MRIGLAIEHFAPERGGAEHWTYQFARQLTRRGHTVHVVAQTFSAAAGSLPIFAHPLGRIRSRLHRGEACQEALRRLNLDIVHDMGMSWCGDVFTSHDGSRIAQWEQKLRILPTALRPWKRLLLRVLPRYQEFRRLMARQYADPQRVYHAVSTMVANDSCRYQGLRREQVRVICYGVDTERFTPDACRVRRHAMRRRLGVDDRTLLLLFVGHDYVRKGLTTAIRAVGRLLATGHRVRLAVVGGHPTGAHRRLAQRNGAAGAVDFLGMIADPTPYYAAADVCVLPTYYDPCSLAVLEASACGLPCITTPNNGVSELLADGLNGRILADPSDDATLAAQIETFLDADARWRMGQAARQLALQYPLDQACCQFEAVYEDVLRRRCSPRQRGASERAIFWGRIREPAGAAAASSAPAFWPAIGVAAASPLV